ncbi:Ser-Thr-rich glycosyl-phosphatidyl-inositol-anchored membrane family-domain-containing protein [Cercophora samala]|uniref:Ser-Thr-rich glycosyl-phosphatidyl-inositol-anchored membrane family-domain-containing protein n=1 Tax=Cercophora samala TaxID=330535 RepID=A0AA40D9X7_9PEZI|nr:Ser-Thr-rich glycosyl-phosphatidyl-inositol-anchored membrane family-domain-containing protein [Cercophora samala]
MRVLSLFSLAAAALPLASAIQFTSPAGNSTLSKGNSYKVKWDSVDTDPSTFSIYLVNFVNWPPFYTQLAGGVSTESGEYEVTVPCLVDASWGYQFNAINGTNVYVIHAQTPKFYVGEGSCDEPEEEVPIPVITDSLQQTTCEAYTVTASPEPTGTCDNTVSTVTATVTATVTVGKDAPAAPATTAPATLEYTPGFQSAVKVYSTVYVDLSEVIDSGECVC